ncbi:MAG: response regulator transcription factor [Flavobacteriales bacterium]|nr:response regulator transcription factor [Flavobacteriales bacterium]
MKINCIIIEDEPLALKRAKGFIETLPFLNLVAAFNSSIEALSFLTKNHVDLLFLDINMDRLSGIQLLENINFQGKVIITTAYDKYALKGYELNVSDYLLKPYTFERFVKAVNKVHAQLEEKETSKQSNFLFIKTENRLEKVDLEDIIYIEGMRDYRRVHTSNTKIMSLQTFTEFERLISPSVLVRVHKSYMVAIHKIESIEKNRIRINDLLIPISNSYRASFFEQIDKI